MKWYALFSQSGTEIVEISNRLCRWPDQIITNQKDDNRINKQIDRSKLNTIRETLTDDVYRSFLGDSTDKIVTLNGWLRIVPPSICEDYTIYNGHPGLITKYPQLKGKDPQEKAVRLGLKTSGSVIHEVVAEVDAGEILVSQEVSIEGLDTVETIKKLHNISVNLWVKFLQKKLQQTI